MQFNYLFSCIAQSREGWVSWKFVWIKFDGEKVKKKRKEKLKVQYWDAYTISVYVIFPAIKR